LKTGTEDEKLRSSEYLTELQDLNGLKYYLDWVRKYKKTPWTSRSECSQLLHLQSRKAIPYLIELLRESYRPDFGKDDYGLFSQYILDALSAIALRSDKDYKIVRERTEKFIRKNKEKIQNVNFLNIFIEKLDQQYYVAKSEKPTIEDVLKKLSLISDGHESTKENKWVRVIRGLIRGIPWVGEALDEALCVLLERK